ncbi:MAG: hypothetical protein EOP88_13585 [Verrucomicrobiaceae bacterium]|nr:MAG: hypothetical protein EOP88_13585 [Verrucomicrobiaceae bacterium]
MESTSTLAIIGGGPSALFTLQHGLNDVGQFGSRFSKILIFERQAGLGAGMPYSRFYTSGLNLSNISSEELPDLPQSLADWLSAQSSARLREYHITGEIRKDEIYPRVALGDYFQAQFETICGQLESHGISVEIHADSEVADVEPWGNGYHVIVRGGRRHECGTVVIATGHHWKKDEDGVNFASPWPIHKLLPPQGTFHRFPIGLLGASLSAVDVVNVLAHHHGKFMETNGMFSYEPSPDAGDFRLVMHSADGLLSHLQFEQEEPARELFRHCSEEDIESLKDGSHLRLSRYFDAVCRPVLVEALREDGLIDEADRLSRASFTFLDFSEMMKEKHISPDPFGLMKTEFKEERAKIRKHVPTRWKEVLDDLMYTLNFHARLLPAEDHLELRSQILPFVMNVMAALPLKSAKILIAVHEADRLSLIPGKAVMAHEKGDATVRVTVGKGEDAEVTCEYEMFIDCAGQAPVGKDSFPFRSLVANGLVTPAISEVLDQDGSDNIDPAKVLKAPGGKRVIELGGMMVTDDYQLVSAHGKRSPGLYDIAVPHEAGLRPYCYGLQACNEAAGILVSALVRQTLSEGDDEEQPEKEPEAA